MPESGPYKVDARLVGKALFGLLVLLGVSYLCGVVLREPIEVGGKAALDRLGYWGLAGGVIITDASPLPMTNEPLVILAIGAGRPANTVFAVISAASVCAGFVGYTCGRTLGDATAIGGWISRRYPGFERFMIRYGAYGVAVCALLPIPFALSTWSAGMMRVKLWKVALASLVRIPKTAFYVWLIMMGWSASGG